MYPLTRFNLIHRAAFRAVIIAALFASGKELPAQPACSVKREIYLPSPRPGVSPVVGEFELSDSPYGTFDQGGNVWEWNETVIGLSRGLRGGSFLANSLKLLASARSSGGPTLENSDVGFRVASVVPEPSTVWLVAMASIGLLLRRRTLC